MIYLDNSATTRPHPSVLESFQQVTQRYFANPSSIHHLGGESEQLLMSARKQVADILNVKEDEVIFTSGGTEGDNIALKGIALEHQNRGKHIITSDIEHPAVYETCQNLEKLGFEITFLPVNKNGMISLKELEQAIRKDTILISIMHVNNEIGAIQPIEEIGKIAKRYPKLYFHVDDVQGLGKVPLDLKDSGVDLCTFSGHKIHGLNGTGVLYVKKGTSLFPLHHGGNQERDIRSGTENLAGAVSCAKALRLIKDQEQKEKKKLIDMHHYLRDQLEQIEGVYINTPKEAAPHILNMSVPGLKPEVVIHMLSEQNIYISTKSACSSKVLDESRIVKALGYSRERASSALRVSLSYDNTMEDIKTFIKVFKETIDQLKSVLQ